MTLSRMNRRTHSVALIGLGFAAGAVTVLLLGRLPGLPEPVQVQSPAQSIVAPVERSYADAVAAAAPAVVNVYGHSGSAAPGQFPHLPADTAGIQRQRRPRGVTSLGSGVLVAADGVIVTNAHIVQHADAIRVELPDGRELDVELLGIDSETDLAVLRASTEARGERLAPIDIGDPEVLAIGDVVLAIGNPFGIGQTVSLGIVSATGRSHLGLTDIENFIQTDAAINPGNSGGALVDGRGRLVGINTAIMSASGRSEGVGFAIPADLVMTVVDQLVRSGEVRRGWIGIGGRSVTPALAARFALRAPHGVLISSVAEDSPAAAAGIRPGDVITRADGQPLHSSLALREHITGVAPGQAIALELWRGSERIAVTATTADRPPGGITARRAVPEPAARHARVGVPVGGCVRGGDRSCHQRGFGCEWRASSAVDPIAAGHAVLARWHVRPELPE